MPSLWIARFHEGAILFSTGFADHEDRDNDRKPVRFACYHVPLPSRSAVLVPGKAGVFAGIEGVAEGSVKLLLQRDIGFARLLLSTRSHCPQLLITNDRNELWHLTRATINASIEETVEAS